MAGKSLQGDQNKEIKNIIKIVIKMLSNLKIKGMFISGGKNFECRAYFYLLNNLSI